ncbi:unnamed protein product, partial [Didymodactylos carnosus]
MARLSKKTAGVSVTDPMEILVLNMRSITAKSDKDPKSAMTKFDLLSAMCNESKPSFIAVTETWLDSTIPNDDIAITGYKLERLDRDREGGGSLLYYQEHLIVRRLSIMEDKAYEIMFFETILPKVGRVLLSVNYRTPSMNNEQIDSYIHFLSETIYNILQSNSFDAILLVGDFNAHCEEWCNTHPSTVAGKKFFDFCEALSLKQLVREPTRVSHNGQ